MLKVPEHLRGRRGPNRFAVNPPLIEDLERDKKKTNPIPRLRPLSPRAQRDLRRGRTP